MLRYLKNQDFAAGMMFFILGVAGVWGAMDYRMGTLARMGPGYFPLLVSSGLVLVGILMLARSLAKESLVVSSFSIRPVVTVTAAVVLFALLVRGAGLALTAIIVIVVAAAASNEFRLREVVLLAGGLAVFSTVIFAILLGIPFKIFPL